MQRLLHAQRRGYAMPLAVLVVVLLFAIGVGLMGLGLNHCIYPIRTSSDIAARCAADSGLAIALFEMNKKLQVNIEIIRYRRECSALRHQGREPVF